MVLIRNILLFFYKMRFFYFEQLYPLPTILILDPHLNRERDNGRETLGVGCHRSLSTMSCVQYTFRENRWRSDRNNFRAVQEMSRRLRAKRLQNKCR